MNNPLISVIIPVYNAEKYISRCLESIIVQTYTNLEIIIIDDGSIDNSLSICSKFKEIDNRIKIYRKDNEGQGVARNFGLKKSSGDFITFVDSDDWIDKNVYRKMINLMKEYNSDIVEVGSYVVDKYKYITSKEKITIKVINGSKNIITDYLYNGMKHSMAGYPVWNKLYKKRCFENKLFDKISRHEDYLINFQIFKNINKIVITSEKLYYYFQHFESTTKGYLELNDLQMVDNCKKVYYESFELENYKISKLAQAKIARCYFSCLSKAVLIGAYDEIRGEVTNILIKKVRESFFLLISSPMPITRKIVLIFLVINGFIPLKKIKYVTKDGN